MPFETGEKASEPFSGPFGEKDWIQPTAQVFGPVYFKAMRAADKYNYCTESSDQWRTGMDRWTSLQMEKRNKCNFKVTEFIFQRKGRGQERLGQKVDY